MSRILKWQFDESLNSTLRVPYGIVRAVGFQEGRLTVWVEHADEWEDRTKVLSFIGTGWPIDTKGHTYVGTAISDARVWHVYEETS